MASPSSLRHASRRSWRSSKRAEWIHNFANVKCACGTTLRACAKTARARSTSSATSSSKTAYLQARRGVRKIVGRRLGTHDGPVAPTGGRQSARQGHLRCAATHLSQR
eukprot:scaffold192370_cov31-Tisochrysis_lutea.AAC.2